MAIYNFEDTKTKNPKKDRQKMVGIIFVAVSLVCLFCLITNLVGFMKSFLLGVAGLFCYPFFITLMAIGFALIGHKKYVMPKKYAVYLSLSIISVLAIVQLILVKNAGISFFEYLGRCYTQKTTAGGILLGIFTAPLLYILDRLGAYIITVALAVVFIALTVDYIRYMSKNEALKKSIKVANKVSNQQQSPTIITVKELEANLKTSTLEQKTPAIEQKPKLTLDAKLEEESAEQSAKRKLGLLASSNIDAEDNSKYFETAEISESSSPKIENRKEYILSRNDTLKLSDYSANQLSKIQENLLKIKNNAAPQESVEPSFVQSTISTSIATNNSMPDKVVHMDNSFVINPPETQNVRKSTIGGFNSTNNLVVDQQHEQIQEVEEDYVVEQEQIVQPKVSIIEEEDLTQNVNTLDVESFTNNVLASFNKQNKEEKPRVTNYQSPQTMFESTKEVKEEAPIMPKEPINYNKPPIELLTTESMDLSLMNQDVVLKREKLELALDDFGIPAKVIGVVIGPAVTRYELEMPAGISIKKLLSLQDDIAYNLSSNGDIRIEAPIPGRRAVGIEVPNEKIATVGLKDIILSREFQENKAGLSVALGKDISGAVKTFSLVKIPHLLIAGTTGSGKSVCINALILSLIYKYSPDELKFILVDPKRVEFSMYNNLPHLLMPNVITDSEKSLNALSWCVDEMERRYVLFSNSRVKNLEEYNSSQAVLEGSAEKLPYIVFIIDELADLLMTAKRDAEDYICRILQKARAAGIHMILATQRPSVDIVTGKIKANLNARICFALMTSADSKTVLDQGGADKLLGKGDMLFMSSDTGVPKRIQGCFVTTKEIDDIVTYIKENNGDYDFDLKTEQAIINPPKNDVVAQIDGDRASNDGFDPLMPQVLKHIIENGHVSISMLQRKFMLGFNRAARIVDQMQEAGYISASDGSKARSIYITMEEYEQLYGEE
ncbi:MAG: DUF87 domain-containing protein [Clostridiales bacterium]|nr:DUF87 domain-containing protein [Clostridiales bacterium]